MRAVTEPIGLPTLRTDGEGAAHRWMDSLAGGLCTPEAFLDAMRDQCRQDRDERWEILSLLDQYYRRGKIKQELFRSLKSRLEDLALGPDDGAAVPPPLPSVTPESRDPIPRTPPAASHEAAPPDLRPAVRELAIGDVLRGRYKVVGIVGQGGMGTVFEAIDEYRLDLPIRRQRLAVKVLHTAVTGREGTLSELQREFQNLQLLSHPNIVRVHEFDRDGEIAFFTMELLDGALLSRVLGTRNGVAMPRPYALAVIRDVGAALSHAHSRGVVHGDINPRNILITDDGELRVLDFGASHKLLENMWNADNELSQHPPVATLGYASCQLLEGQQPDARDDMFAFACVAYVLLSGRHPFPKRTAVEARAQRLRPPRPPGLTGRQWRMLREGLHWERDRRPADIHQWLERFGLGAAAPRLPPLSLLVRAPLPRKRRALLAAAAVLVIGSLAIGGYWLVRKHHSPERFAPPAPAAGSPPSAPAAASPAATRAPSAAPAPAPPPRAALPAPRAAQGAPAHAGSAGPVRIEMAADTIDVPAHETTARVTVRRRGDLRGSASFIWWTESGTAKPGVDFTPVIPRAERIESGKDSVSLSIPISDMPRRQPKSFYVEIDRTESGAALGAKNLTMVTLLPPPD